MPIGLAYAHFCCANPLRIRGLAALCFAVLGLGWLQPGPAHAQALVDGLYVTNGQVHATAVSGNTLYIGGTFTEVGPATGHAALIDTTSGTPSSTFPKADGTVHTIAPDGTGGWYLGGEFTSVGGNPRSNLAHVTSGNTVSSWDPSANGPVRSIDVDGSTIYVGGSFTNVSGQARNRLAALDATTGNATSWNPAPNSEVRTVASDGSVVYIGGLFTSAGGAARNRIAAIDKTTGNATSWNPNANSTVLTIFVDGSTIYAGGSFTSIGGQARFRAAALDATTGNATTWNPGPNGDVQTMVSSGGQVYLGGDFSFIGGSLRNRIAAIDPVTGFAALWNPTANSTVRSIAANGAVLYAAGDFTIMGGAARNRIAAISTSTGTVTSWDPNANDIVRSIAYDGSSVAAGGDFTSVGGQPRATIAAIDLTTGAATAWNPIANGIVFALHVEGSSVYAGGSFTFIGGQSRNRIAELDATTGLATAWNPDANSTVRTIEVQGTTVFVGGFFTSIGGATRPRIAALGVATGTATAWNPVASSTVRALIANGSTVYAAGDFTFIGGQTRNRIAAINAITGSATTWNPNADEVVESIALVDSILYAGGNFTTIGGAPRNRIAALETSSGNATSWNPDANGAVLAVHPAGGTVYAGGSFSSIGGASRNRLAALDASGAAAAGWDPNADGDVRTLVTGSALYAGGDFTTIAGEPRASLAGLELVLSASIDDVAIAEGDAGTAALSFTVTLSESPLSPVTIDYATSDGTATTANGDYVAATGTITFMPGQTTRPIDIDVNGDLTFESDETFTVMLTGSSGASLADIEGLGTIQNDDAIPSLSIGDVAAAEQNGGTQPFGFVVTLSHPTDSPVTVDFATADSTASEAGSDYVGVSGTLTIPAKALTDTIVVDVVGDVTFEADEVLRVVLSNIANATLADAEGLGTIQNDDTEPVLSIDDVSVTEGNADSVAIDFTISLSNPTSSVVSLDYASDDGTATLANGDYRQASGTLTIPAEAPSATLTLYAYGDATRESDESFFVNLSNFVNATVFDGQGQATIENDDATPTLAIGDVETTEGDAGTTAFVFTVSLSNPTDAPVTVDFTTSDGTATAAGNDYQATGGTLTIPAKTPSGTIIVSVNGDESFEADETFFVDLSNVAGATPIDVQGRGIIENDETPPDVTIDDVAQLEGQAGTSAFVFTVRLSTPVGLEATVDYQTTEGTATLANNDFVATTGTLTFPVGTDSAQVSVMVNGDQTLESDETFDLSLSNPVNAALLDSEGTGTIQNDDALPSLTIDDVTLAEGDPGTTAFEFVVRLSNLTDTEVTVDYATVDGTATLANGDYLAATGTATIPAKIDSTVITVQVQGDVTFESDETFQVQLTNPVAATLADADALGTIANDDVVPSMTINDVTLAEGDAGTTDFTFTVALSNPTDLEVTVDYATNDGSATAVSGDYGFTAGTLTIPAKSDSATITVSVNGDTTHEADEDFTLDLANAAGATLTDAQGLGVITNDDPIPVLAIDDVALAEGDAGSMNLVFSVSLSGTRDQTITVDFATSDSTATLANADYVATSGTLTFPAGSSGTQPLSVTVNGDLIHEADEAFLVDLVNPLNATLGDPRGIGTIQNDDPQPVLTVNDVFLLEGNSGTTAFEFTVSLSSLTDQSVTLDYVTSDGSATLANNDYQSASGTLSIPPLTASGTIAVSVNGDVTLESDETFFLDLSNVSNATLIDPQAQGTIQNEDNLPNLSIDDVERPEGDTGTTSFDFIVRLSNRTDTEVTVGYFTLDGSASSAGDYQPTSGILTIPAKADSGVISVLVDGETIFESDETFSVLLSSPVGAQIVDPQGDATIENDDGFPAISIDNIAINEGATGTTEFEFTVSLSNPSSQAVTVDYATGDGTATVASGDYQFAAGTLTLLPGAENGPITVLVNGDVDLEAAETFFVNLSSPTGATIFDGQGQAIILNDDAPPSISIIDVAAVEGDAGTTAFDFTVVLSNASNLEVTVDFDTRDGSATLAHNDYQATSGTLTFPAFSTTPIPITVLVQGDVTYEFDQDFFVDLSNPVGGTLADAEAQGTIQNDDPLPVVSVGDVTLGEGDAGTTDFEFDVTLTNPAEATLTVNYSTSDGSATTANNDYVAVGGLLTIPGDTAASSITAQVHGDLTFEGDETFNMHIFTPSLGTIGDGQGIGTIQNDDTLPSLSIGDIAIAEGDAGTTVFELPITLSHATDEIVTIDFATADGTATIASGDYQASSGTVTIPAKTIAAVVTVLANGDDILESDEDFFVNLSNETNVILFDGQGRATLVNDDALPSMAIADTAVTEGDAGTSPMTFTVSLSNPSDTEITVQYATADDLAESGSDFVAAAGVLTIAAKAPSATFDITVHGDVVHEADEPLVIYLFNASGATISDFHGEGTILNDDPVPAVAIADATEVEGDAGTTALGFQVTLSGPTDQVVSIPYSTSDGTATLANDDYFQSSGVLNIQPQITVSTIIVQGQGDTSLESDETFAVDLGAPTHATLLDGQGIGTLQNDDVAPVMTITDFTRPEGDSGTQSYDFVVRLSNLSDQAVLVDWTTNDGSAIAAEGDYVAASGTATIPAKQDSVIITIQVGGDLVFEQHESFTVDLSNAVGASIGDAQGVGTILNEDSFPLISIGDLTLNEGNSGQTVYSFDVTLSNPSEADVTVQYATFDGSAWVADNDYVATSGVLTIPPLTTAGVIAVDVQGDIKFEQNEEFVVNLSSPSGGALLDGQGLGLVMNDDTAPVISIANVSQSEGDFGSQSFDFDVTLSNPSYQDVTVDFQTGDVTATAASGDYDTASGTLTISAGSTSGSIGALVNGDVLHEGNETFTVTLSNPSNGSIGDGEADGEIENDDAVPAIAIGDVGLAEGNSGTTGFGFAVSLTNPSEQEITVDYATANGTAKFGQDYFPESGTLTFPAGSLTPLVVTIDVKGDITHEADEIFFVDLSNPAVATIADDQAVGTIQNDDAFPSLSIADVSQSEGDAGTTAFDFSVSLTGPIDQDVTVDYTTVDGSAASLSDFVATSGTLTINSGSVSGTIPVQVLGDVTFESDEAFTVLLSNIANATLADASANGTIQNDDGEPDLIVADDAPLEGSSGVVIYQYVVRLTNPTDQIVTVDFETRDGDATRSDGDYVETTGTLTIPAESDSAIIAIPIDGDTKFEPDEDFRIEFSGETNAGLPDDRADLLIVNDDPLPALSVDDVSLPEGDAGTTPFTFSVSLSNPSHEDVDVSFATADGSATVADGDYDASSGPLIIASGDTLATFDVTVNGDAVFESDEAFSVTLSNPGNATILDGAGLATIQNDDSAPVISIDDVTLAEGDAGTVSFVFTASLSNPSALQVTADYATSDGTATLANGDYLAAAGTLTIPAGSPSTTVSVTVNGDVTLESDETFTLDLTSLTNADPGDLQGVGTIQNDDTLPSLSIADVVLVEGDTGSSTADFAVVLSNPTDSEVTVAFASADGSATLANGDYVQTTGTLTIPAKADTGWISVDVQGDVTLESDETFVVNLSVPVNATILDGQGLGTIQNDDTLPTLSIADVADVEGDTGTRGFGFGVQLSNPTDSPVTVDYVTVAGTATLANGDFQATSGTLTIPAKVDSGVITVIVNGDVTFESSETFFVNLSNPSNAVIFDGQGQGTIQNDDSQPTITIRDVALIEGNAGTAAFEFGVVLSNPTDTEVTVAYATANGTATVADADYQAALGVLTIPAKADSGVVTVLVNGDTKFELDETFVVNLSSPTGATLFDGQGQATIQNDDALPQLSIEDALVVEGHTGTTALGLVVALDHLSYQPTTVDYATTDGTATLANNDYVPAFGTLTIPAESLTDTIFVDVNGDATLESDETFSVDLAGPGGATILDGQGIGTIQNDDTLPSISITDVALGEGDAGTTVFQFDVTLSNPTDQAVTVDYTTADGSATLANGDYQFSAGTALIVAKTLSTTISVPVQGDVTFESTETFFVNLASPSGATILDGQGQGTIQNDDVEPTLAIGDVIRAEGDAGTTSFDFVVHLSNPTDSQVTVGFVANDGSATLADSDFQAASGTLTIPAKADSGIISVQVIGDTTFEPTETFTVDLAGATGAILGDPQGLGTIVNDDAAPTLAIGNAVLAEGDAGTTAFVFPVTLSNPSAVVVTVDFATVEGTATIANNDYQPGSGTVTLLPGSIAESVTVLVNGDVTLESTETFNVELSNLAGATFADSVGTGVIQNDDVLPSLSINDITMNEGDAGTTLFTFTVRLSNPTDAPVTVDFTTADGTATLANGDYQANSGTLTIPAKGDSALVSVLVQGDVTFESNETFTVDLSNAAGATIGDAQGLGTITNDDTVPVLTITDVMAHEQDGGTPDFVFTVRLSNPTDQAVTVDYATADSTAEVSDDDYQAASGTLTIPAKQDSVTLVVEIEGDNTNEEDEVFHVVLSNPSNAAIADTIGRGVILNDDGPPQIFIDDVTLAEGDTGTTDFVFTVSLSNPTSRDVKVDYTTVDGTATDADGDYDPVADELKINKNTLSKTFTVPVNGDAKFEGDETFTIELSNPDRATIGDSTAVGTILNDDAAPILAIDDVIAAEGDAGTTSFVFSVTVTGESQDSVKVDFTTADGSATTGSGDYVAASGTLAFGPSNSPQSVTVDVQGDLVHESDESFTVQLGNPTIGVLGDSVGIGTITNDDSAPTVSVSDTQVVEGHSGTGFLSYSIGLSRLSDQAVTVDFTTADGTATLANGDYQATSGTLTIPPLTAGANVLVGVNGDTTLESDETVLLDLSNPAVATLGDAQGVGTILNDDVTPTLSIGDVVHAEGDSGLTAYVFGIQLSNPTDQPVTVDYTTVDGSATSANNDYQAASGTLTIAAKSDSVGLTIQVQGDLTLELNETFFVDLSNPVGASILDGQGAGGILNDDGVPNVTISDVALFEGDTGTTAFDFAVRLSNQSAQAITVDFATSDGTASSSASGSVTPTADYAAISGTVTIPAKTDSVTVRVLVNGDTVFEPDENFFVDLSNATNAVIADAQGEGTILNDDSAPVLSIDDVTGLEGDTDSTGYVFTVSLTAVTDFDIEVDYATSDGTATIANGDYTPVAGTLSISAGDDTPQTITVWVHGDSTFESDETFFLDLSNPVNASIGDGQGQGTVENDDTTPSLTIDNVIAGEGDSGTKPYNFKVSLSHPTDTDVTVEYATSDSTATLANDDYVATSGVLTIPAKTTTASITVFVNGDSTHESHEAFLLTLGNASGATLSNTRALGAILNDDGVPRLLFAPSRNVVEGDAGTTVAELVVFLDRPSDTPVTVDFATIDGSATLSNGDYVGASGSLSFPAKSSEPETVMVVINGDVTHEADENFRVFFFNLVGASFLINQSIITIQDDDEIPVVSIDDVSEFEGDVGFQLFTFTISLSAPTSSAVTIDFATADSSATEPDDYLAVSGTITIPAKTLTAEIEVVVLGDQDTEIDEVFHVLLSNPSGARMADSIGVCTIRNDDGVLSVGDGTSLGFGLGAIGPNPMRGSARIEYTMAHAAAVRIRIVDLQGRVVATVVDGIRDAGRHQTTWRGRSERGRLAAGVYFVRFEAAGTRTTQRLILMR